jgi:hypothetical protein
MELTRPSQALALAALAFSLAVVSGCASRSVDVRPLPANAAEFTAWSCERIADEADRVQRRAADLAYTVDERAGNNMVALGLGALLFWPALLAMRSDGPEAEELGRLRGRHDALNRTAQTQACLPLHEVPLARSAGGSPVVPGDCLVYEDRRNQGGPASEWGLRLTALRRAENEYLSVVARACNDAAVAPDRVWRQDHAGNITAAPDGALQWPHLLRGELALGGVTAGDILVTGDPESRARVRGQVVAVGPQTIAGRHFDVAVIELFGDALHGDIATRLEGVIVVDRNTGVLLRLDLRSAQGDFSLQRRLVRVDAPNG